MLEANRRSSGAERTLNVVDHRGTLAETAIRLALVERGLRVLEPISPQPYDLVVHAPGGRFITLQVKHGRLRAGCVVANACSTDHGRGRRSYAGRADLLAIYAPELRRSFVVPVVEAPRYAVALRVEPARNGQAAGVRQAEDHALERWAASLAEEPRDVARSPAP